MFKPTTRSVVQAFERDVVYLVQFPRTHTIVSSSPFSLKLETWLRANKIPYRNVNNDGTKGSAKGQVPFIELNGRHIADSNFIIDHLSETFDVSLDRHLTTRQRAEARAISVLIEESLFRCLAYDRSIDYTWLGTAKGYLPSWTGWKKIILPKFVPSHVSRGLKRILLAQGYGRHSPSEIEAITKKDLVALSELLGDKKYLFGDQISTVDVTMFGHVVEFLDAPLQNDQIKSFIELSCSNLIEFCNRVKAEYWPNWNEIIEHLIFNKEEGAEPAAEEQ